VIVIESPPLGVAFAVNTRYRGPKKSQSPKRRLLPHRPTGWAQFTRRREVVCGVNKDRRADTEQIFTSFSIEFVKLSPSAAMVTSTQTADGVSERGGETEKKSRSSMSRASTTYHTPKSFHTTQLRVYTPHKQRGITRIEFGSGLV